ncbi:hypothetical protein LSCM4_01946 [Leishmania orientalis]|uniref:C2H2-type domain-containing protein n=1 Tax=Leishmania orientalis TaxID=2249476 RepID=A0A836KFY7_9TRYP|nr:hypothetical protein LSCM4_01946 [Leishmania orientalis]
MLRRAGWRRLSGSCCGLPQLISATIGPPHHSVADRCACGATHSGAPTACRPSSSLLAASLACACDRATGAALRTSLRRSSGVAGLPANLRAVGNLLNFEPPSSMSHNALAYAACPMCGRVVHMSQMLHHILSTHKEQDAAYWTRLCNARLALYERITGAPLEGADTICGAPSTADAAGVADASDAEKALTAELSLSTTLSADDALRPFLPTVSEAGTYTCNWCTLRSAAFSSRDAFLLHVAKDHPKLDFDIVESLVPQPPAISPRAARSSGAGTPSPVVTGADADAAMSDSWTTPRGVAKSVGAASHSLKAEGRHYIAYPVCRMPGVRTVEETNVLTLEPDVRQVGVTVGREGAKVFDPAPISSRSQLSPAAVFASSTASAMASASDLSFAEGCFPCELCSRIFVSELNLLQHLESKHANPNADVFASARGADANSDAGTECSAPPDSAAAPSRGASVSAVGIFATCDHCVSKKKVFRSSSALFSHIRFRHPAEDAAYETERMIEEQKHSRLFKCPKCSYRHPDDAELEAHLRDVHGVVGRASGSHILQGHSVARAAQALDSTAPKAAQPSLFSALPPLTMRARFWCNACERGFSNASALYAHTESKHDIVARLYPCPACKREFRDIPSLELHIETLHKNFSLRDMGLQSSVECPDCQRHFLDHESLHEHAVRHHGKSAIAPVRSFLTPASTSTAGDGAHAAPAQVPGTSANASGSMTLPPAASATPAPRKVTRRKKAPSRDAAAS